MMWPGRTTRRAFSLVELVVVIVIIGLMGAIAVPRFASAQANQRIEAAADRLITDFGRTQARARAASAPATITFVPASDRYGIGGAGGNAITVTLADAPYQTDIVSADFGGSATATFNAFGVPASDGTVVLKSGDRTITVKLNAFTGRATR